LVGATVANPDVPIKEFHWTGRVATGCLGLLFVSVLGIHDGAILYSSGTTVGMWLNFFPGVDEIDVAIWRLFFPITILGLLAGSVGAVLSGQTMASFDRRVQQLVADGHSLDDVLGRLVQARRGIQQPLLKRIVARQPFSEVVRWLVEEGGLQLELAVMRYQDELAVVHYAVATYVEALRPGSPVPSNADYPLEAVRVSGMRSLKPLTGDLIVACNGRPVQNVAELQAAAASVSAGAKVPVLLLHWERDYWNLESVQIDPSELTGIVEDARVATLPVPEEFYPPKIA
jgi:hypothetical protein